METITAEQAAQFLAVTRLELAQVLDRQLFTFQKNFWTPKDGNEISEAHSYILARSEGSALNRNSHIILAELNNVHSDTSRGYRRFLLDTYNLDVTFKTIPPDTEHLFYVG